MTVSRGEELVLRTAAEHGVPGPVAQELLAGARPCLHLVAFHDLTPAQQEEARPAARTGGLPSLPDGVDWPDERDPLVLTVDCAALPREALDIELPSDGELLFFTQIEYEPESSVVLHVPDGVRTTERSATYELDGEAEQVRVYRPGVRYPVPGLTVSPDWRDGPATGAFLDGGADRDDVLDAFEDAVRSAAAGGASHGVAVQLGGFSSPWQSAPDEGDLVLLAQIHGQSIDSHVYTQTLIVGTRADIARRRYEALQFEQQV
ncbi:DUF1963 domain-containing protein [Streptomyces hilarionis]|uniref:DUF1963 domain-containing protein n=1 Tax=Streptomyces hilarionis TaxID=2839954 RepID=UPI00211A112B|nr:DUF1963 domain-containing protein [Streptomyces hilarionis]MCQ9131481.1 DUF1963 domain-containing protein [Streptomyces hilarionis]